MLPEEDIGLILLLKETKDKFWSVALFSPNRGLHFPLIRRSRTHSPPDLFDTGRANLTRSKQGDLHFLSNYEPIRRRSGIARSYLRVQIASRFADILRRNAQHFPEPSLAFPLFEKFFDAIEQSSSPHAAYLKTLYILAKNEGLPVREHWANGLSTEIQTDLATVLTTPLENQPSNPGMFQFLITSLEKWMEHEAHFQIPSTSL